MNAKSVQERPQALAEPVPQQPPAPTPTALRPATGLVLGLVLSTVLWLAILVVWLALR